MLIVSHDREILDRVTQRTLFLRSDGVHAFRTRFSVAREELLRRDATAAARARLEEKEIKRLEQAAARYKVWAVKNPDLNKRKAAVETRIARIEADRTQTYVARERRLELADGDIDAKVALRLASLDVKTPDGRKLIAIDRLTIAAGDRIALLGINGAGKSTLLSALAAAYDPDARALRRPGAGALQSVLPAGLLRPDHAGPAGEDDHPRLCPDGRRHDREGGDPRAGAGGLRLRPHQASRSAC